MQNHKLLEREYVVEHNANLLINKQWSVDEEMKIVEKKGNFVFCVIKTIAP